MVRGVGRITATVCALGLAVSAFAAELKVVDATGLLRAVRVVGGNARIVVTILQPPGALHGECVATNVDGLSSEKRVPISPKGECVFMDMAVGSWQITLPVQGKWRAQIYE